MNCPSCGSDTRTTRGTIHTEYLTRGCTDKWHEEGEMGKSVCACDELGRCKMHAYRAQSAQGDVIERHEEERVRKCDCSDCRDARQRRSMHKNPSAQTDMIERMLRAYHCDSSVAFGETNRMTAAACVLLDEALGPVTDAEWGKASEEARINVNRFLASLRARVLPKPQTKNAEEHQ
jgi:hypothetical protein